jgi:APA family basic amino acid/polyamine antiporter
MNGMILTGPRVYYAMACQGVFPPLFGQISEHYRTPIAALVIQGAWACLLAASGTYEQLFTHVIFTAWIFYGLGVAAALVLRHSQPGLKRPFCVPGYPWIPLFFCFAALGLILNTLIERPTGVLVGLGFIASGIPVYFYAIRRAS